MAFHYAGLAASQHNLGLGEEALRNLENDGFACVSDGRTLPRAKVSSILHALYARMEDADRAESWKAYLCSLDCPDATKKVFLERATLILERCTQKGSLVVL